MLPHRLLTWAKRPGNVGRRPHRRVRRVRPQVNQVLTRKVPGTSAIKGRQHDNIIVHINAPADPDASAR